MMYDCSDDMEKPITEDYVTTLEHAAEFNGLFKIIIRKMDENPRGQLLNWTFKRDRLRKINKFIDDMKPNQLLDSLESSRNKD